MQSGACNGGTTRFSEAHTVTPDGCLDVIFGPCRAIVVGTMTRALGYADQSQLVTEFRALTGLTPSRWARSRHPGSKSPRSRTAPSLS